MSKGSRKAYSKAHRFLCAQESSENDESSLPTATSLPSPNSLLGVPVEIKQAIFSSLPDVASLKALILTCTCLYHAFLDAASPTLTKILQAQIDPRLMRDAVTTYHSSRIPPRSRPAAQDLLRGYIQSRNDLLRGYIRRRHDLLKGYIQSRTPLVLPTWILHSALELSEMHGHVQYFAYKFISFALSHNPVSGRPEKKAASISLSEITRIQRTLYRFEIYYNVFAEPRGSQCLRRTTFNHDTFDHDVIVRDEYLSKGFAPWENEQLACIRDFLLEELCSCTCYSTFVFRDYKKLIDLAFKRAANKHYPGKDWSEYDPKSHLSLGLARLHRLILAETRTERDQILHGQSPANEDVLLASLDSRSNLYETPLQDLTEEEQRVLVPPQVADDNDNGPVEAWWWVHAGVTPNLWYNNVMMQDVRRWGYVMWDSARLAEWKVLDRDWLRLPVPRGKIGNYRLWLSREAESGIQQKRQTLLQRLNMFNSHDLT
ncbi:hypothetical protein IMSHALPRED_010107 [Imshaugia aleurites]|uniref:F-box domain-containing protein n=1 Tax=Imshaugia aleurites TaxID=172621 RepID=A0A8H3G2M3_9LECA|nr:hypothetical protein IMSHALPRED_010107 [Imshaugia aleurites]